MKPDRVGGIVTYGGLPMQMSRDVTIAVFKLRDEGYSAIDGSHTFWTGDRKLPLTVRLITASRARSVRAGAGKKRSASPVVGHRQD